MYSEEFLNNLRKVVDFMRIESMTKLERRKYYKSKLKPAHNRIKKEKRDK